MRVPVPPIFAAYAMPSSNIFLLVGQISNAELQNMQLRIINKNRKGFVSKNLCSGPSSITTASNMGIYGDYQSYGIWRFIIFTIMAVLAVLLIHMESRAVGSMKPRSSCAQNEWRKYFIN